MNRTRIEWTDYTWNPVTGCWGPGGTAEKPNRCPYCYAHSISKRFTPGHAEVFLNNNDPFAPHFHQGRLLEPRQVNRPSRIFVCSMADLFGEWVPRKWIEAIRLETAVVNRHTYIFLTKNPARLAEFNPWPGNCWVGATATDEESFAEAAAALARVDSRVRFISAEPLLGEIRHFTIQAALIDWLIIGALTGPGAKPPCPDWVQTLSGWAKYMDIRRFLKDNLNWPEKIQEWPGRP